MRVKELVSLLSMCNPEVEVTISHENFPQGYANVEGVEELVFDDAVLIYVGTDKE